MPFETTTHLRKVELFPHDSNWTASYTLAIQKLMPLFDSNLIDIQHVGSTSIPNIKAKPVIDIMIVVKQIEKVDQHNETMQQLGYVPHGEYGVVGRRFFTKDHDHQRIQNVHTFQIGNIEIDRMIMFRDYLRGHVDEALAYEALKLELAQKFPMDVHAYAAAKSDFVNRILDARRLELIALAE